MKHIFTWILVALAAPCFFANAQDGKSTRDLSFLLGEWEVRRVYRPEEADARELSGTLSCQWALDSTFIECLYVLERPGMKRGLDQVYFNYNSIYDAYESTWLSATWPIKVLMQGDLRKATSQKTILTSKASFLIEGGVTEYVTNEWSIHRSENGIHMDRKTFIRTSTDADDDWFHHMNEFLKPKTLKAE